MSDGKKVVIVINGVLTEVPKKEAKIPKIEKSLAFTEGEIVKKEDGCYYTKRGIKLDVPTMRIMWLLADRIIDQYPNMTSIGLCNYMWLCISDVEKVNGDAYYGEGGNE